MRLEVGQAAARAAEVCMYHMHRFGVLYNSNLAVPALFDLCDTTYCASCGTTLTSFTFHALFSPMNPTNLCPHRVS